MKKLKAYFLQWCHLWYHLFRFFTTGFKEYPHQGYTVGISTKFCGIQIWFKPTEIGCYTCGKCYYKSQN